MSESSLKGKLVVITGAASGIGRTTALKLASQGAILALLDINDSDLAPLHQDRPSSATHASYKCDVSSSASCNDTIATIVATQGPITHLFNCAGINPTQYRLEDTTDAYFDSLVGVNLRGPYNMTRAAIPHLSSGSTITNVTSTLGLQAEGGFAIYCATKFGLIGFTKAMARELGPQGIRVNAVAPGPIDTPTMAGNVAGGDANEKLRAGVALGRIGSPEEVADVVAFLMGEESRYVSGSVVEVHGGMAI